MLRWVVGAILLLAACDGDDENAAQIDVLREQVAALERQLAETPPPTRTATSTATPEPTEAAPELSLAEWAAAYCASTLELMDSFASVNDGIDPTTLSLEDRVQRGRTMHAVQLRALDRSIADLETMNPPADVAGYHGTSIAEMVALSHELRRVQALPDATSHGEIEVRNALRGVATSEESAAFEAESQNLSVAAVAAIWGVARCGAVVAPTPTPIPTPQPTATAPPVAPAAPTPYAGLPRLVITQVAFNYGDGEPPTVRLKRDGDLIAPAAVPVEFGGLDGPFSLHAGETIEFEYDGGVLRETLEQHNSIRTGDAITLVSLWNTNPGESVVHTVRVRFVSDRHGPGPWSNTATFNIAR